MHSPQVDGNESITVSAFNHVAQEHCRDSLAKAESRVRSLEGPRVFRQPPATPYCEFPRSRFCSFV